MYTFPDGTLRPCAALHGRVHGPFTVHGRVDGRCAAAYGSCTRPCNVSCARYTATVNTPSLAKTARTRPYNGRAVYMVRTRPCMGRAHGPSTPPVYMTVYGPSVCTSSAVHMARTRPRTRDVYTAVTGRTRPSHAVWERVHGPVGLPAMYTAQTTLVHAVSYTHLTLPTIYSV